MDIAITMFELQDQFEDIYSIIWKMMLEWKGNDSELLFHGNSYLSLGKVHITLILVCVFRSYTFPSKVGWA